MLSSDDNQKLTRVGRGTVLGDYFRRHWLPACLAEEIEESDGAPVRVRLLGEDLVAFRDTDGRVGLVDAFCPHRRAPMVLARNEECGLRCVYHGWKFDVTGTCVDLPNEPPSSVLKDRVRIESYPTVVAGGVVWTHLGEPSTRPSTPPALPWVDLPDDQRIVSKRLQESNWAQALEGGIDSSHVGYLHREWEPSSLPLSERRVAPIVRSAASTDDQLRAMSYLTHDTHPRFFVDDADFGMWIGARRSIDGADSFYWRITPLLLPCYTIIPPLTTDESPDQIAYDGHAFVPIDDENTWIYNMSWREGGPFTQEETEDMRSPMGTHAPTETGPIGLLDGAVEGYVPVQNPRNSYHRDRELQRTTSFTGIRNANTQDRAVQELMGRIVDRSAEHLGTSDRAIIAFRRMMLHLADGGRDRAMTTAPDHPERYWVRAASVVLETDEEFVKYAAETLMPS